MATKPTEASQVISDVAKAEGGTTKGQHFPFQLLVKFH